jgi:preprotein translocase subunit SecE
MGKLGNMVGGSREFVGEVRTELTKCAWPTRPELMESTVVVIISCLILAAFVGLSDGALLSLMGLIIR